MCKINARDALAQAEQRVEKYRRAWEKAQHSDDFDEVGRALDDLKTAEEILFWLRKRLKDT